MAMKVTGILGTRCERMAQEPRITIRPPLFITVRCCWGTRKTLLEWVQSI